jgi:hypothetical protein
MSSGITGKVHFIGPTESFGTKGFQKRLLVLEQEDGRFSNFIPLEATGDRTYDLDEVQLGDEVKVLYVLKGRKWQKDPNSDVKYFLSAEIQQVLVLNAEGDAGEEMLVDDDTPF